MNIFSIFVYTILYCRLTIPHATTWNMLPSEIAGADTIQSQNLPTHGLGYLEEISLPKLKLMKLRSMWPKPKPQADKVQRY